jgi:restriction system protein
MARRRKTTALEDAVEILGWLFRFIPPWVSIPIALIGLVAVPMLVLRPSEPADPANPVSRGIHEFLSAPFAVLRWGIGAMWAGVWLLGGLAGWRARREREAFLQETIDLKWLWGLSWQDFERQVAELFRQQGCQVEVTGGGGSDGGVDLIVTRNGEKTYVQCKHWREGKVGVKPVRELYGLMTAEGAQHGILITSGKFTDKALEFAAGKPLQLIDGGQCAQMFRNFQRSVAGAGRSQPATGGEAGTVTERSSSLKCPECGSAMVLRRAKRGKHAGKEFWGCSQYPDCPGMLNIES